MQKLFIRSAGVLLVITAVAKIISSFGVDRILQYHDPIFAVPFRLVFIISGGLEIIIAIACFSGMRVILQASLVALLATNFLIYRLGLILVDYHRPCSCMGTLTDTIHIPPDTADTAMKIALAYLLVGSYGILFCLRRQRHGTTVANPSNH